MTNLLKLSLLFVSIVASMQAKQDPLAASYKNAGIADQFTAFAKSASITLAGLVLGEWIAGKSNNASNGLLAGALAAIAIDHYCCGGSNDPCIARKVGYVIPLMLSKKAVEAHYEEELRKQLMQKELDFYFDTDNIMKRHCNTGNRLQSVLFKVVYFASIKNKQPLDTSSQAAINSAWSEKNLIKAINSIDEITTVKIAQIGVHKIVLDEPVAIRTIVDTWEQKTSKADCNIVHTIVGESGIISFKK